MVDIIGRYHDLKQSIGLSLLHQAVQYLPQVVNPFQHGRQSSVYAISGFSYILTPADKTNMAMVKSFDKLSRNCAVVTLLRQFWRPLGRC